MGQLKNRVLTVRIEINLSSLLMLIFFCILEPFDITVHAQKDDLWTGPLSLSWKVEERKIFFFHSCHCLLGFKGIFGTIGS